MSEGISTARGVEPVFCVLGVDHKECEDQARGVEPEVKGTAAWTAGVQASCSRSGIHCRFSSEASQE
jgi:hypothetical protein